MVNEYRTSPHRAVRCTFQQLLVLKKLPGTSGGKANDKDKEDRKNWDLKQDIGYLDEGIDDELKHFEECLREESVFLEECHKEAEAI